MTSPRMTPPRPRSRDLHASPTLRIGRFRCDPDDELWRSDNQIGPWPLLAFPGTAVEILQSGRPAVVATSQQVVLYNPHQEYRRRLIDARGDRCVYLSLDPGLLHGALAGAGAAGDDLARPFRGASAAIDARLAARALLLASAAQRGRPATDALAFEEEALAIVAAIAAGMARRPASPRGRAAAGHAELARAIARVVAERYAEGDDLAAIAGRVGASPFHAARVFRAATGSSIHALRSQLRLHAALLRLAEAGADLATIAVDVGFASHSHMSEAFRRAYGASPSRLRADLRAGRIRADAASTILKAGPIGPR